MKTSFAFALLAMVLGLVCAAPTGNPEFENINCFSLTYPVNGTVWNSSGTYEALWDLTGTCSGTYYAFIIPATEESNGDYTFGTPYQASDSIDLNAGMASITLDSSEPAGKYVFGIIKDTGDDMDYTDVALVDIV
ncbi:hypothetical protein J3Q64DRAFT_1840719 [Phycomyces blakesleeanus]|uniref:Secreted protein n=2 Tax=Phycomyces blakesleeanus TaxID=4837 RepID=A0A167LZ81_PHYB8|nr:hypothetical protein PHYBLDRAFT_147889 [Phycomyces blakesleeanus NRRL 1555(-)]XP_018289438.1 hypothetical protein PHYBLDRAFT_66348 [Phycomyces blakesleeanus NRRL 1555(-)]XP_018289439.1 hypothetical protein PHYBLDRAFT_170763 [Phycomyces blakesleeanus NRRL 1555(-)]OAD71395.1 hypothetical protein PHYBLDRAFT_147889 [Phycomyces blakesleeanus NRRL 1555(-)]OAD71398.1 hypothetical protein PHYBLDRAFT_66348 [Phycomyces blakesleeanus NRRL 1555(-)]OAD71399.1 hypothetical protein PHYBLDRAFT_170763 [Phyc|eukprot:XP_018289435.1 hypothetical protein PHYBLDRAFT_147889 [Phycomyces blakesleeanus NRRL 1555(-)]